MLINEWQLVPGVWDSVRRAVDDDRSSDRFIRTGSARNAVSQDLHPGAGRFSVVRLEPMTLSERVGTEPAIKLDSLVERGIDAVRGVRSPLSKAEQVALMFRSGLPEYFAPDLTDHQRVLRTYLDLNLARELEGTTGVVRSSAKL